MTSEQTNKAYGLFPSMNIYISEYKNMLFSDLGNLHSLEDIKINIGRRIPDSIVEKGFKDVNEFLREFNKDNPHYEFSEKYIDLDNTNIPYQINIKWVYSKDELELLNELSEEVKKLFRLKRTEVIIDPNDRSRCEHNETIKCYVESEDDMIHEMVHAHYREIHRKLKEQLEEARYQSKIRDIIPDKYLEEISARIISYNIQHKQMRKCPGDTQMLLTKIIDSDVGRIGTTYYSIGADIKLGEYVELGEYNNIEIVKKVLRLYRSIYDFLCICPKDFEFYQSIKDDVDPLATYNKLAKYVGIRELKWYYFL